MAEHNVNTVKAQIQSLINLANETTGNTDTNLTDGVNALVSGYGQGGDLPTDTLVGLENGYDVMFYDENNEGLAFYSIRKGDAITPPIYNTTEWVDGDGGVISFPYTPKSDIILYPLIEDVVYSLYEYYGVDKETYPYLFINIRPRSSSSYVNIYFCAQYSEIGETALKVTNYCSQTNTTNEILSISDEDLLTKVLEISMHATVNLSAVSGNSTIYHNANSYICCYTNIEITGYDTIITI